MSRREVVFLASRVIAMLQISAATVDACASLPLQVALMVQRSQMLDQLHTSRNMAPLAHYPSFWLTGLVPAVARISVLLLIAAIFWNAGPTIEGWLTPKDIDSGETA